MNQGSPSKLTYESFGFQDLQGEQMALRAAATACKFGGRQRNPTLFAIPLYLQLKLHQNQPQTFTSAAPIHQPGEWFGLYDIKESRRNFCSLQNGSIS